MEIVDQLANRSFQNTRSILEGFGNSLNTDHAKALEIIAYEMAAISILGNNYKTVVCSPDTGYGKTTSIVGFCKAVIELEFELEQDISILICAEKVESICRLKRDLIRESVPEQRIGLYHSYRYNSDDSNDNLKSGYASEPSILIDEIKYKQFALVTHARAKDSYKGYYEISHYQKDDKSLTSKRNLAI